MTAERDLTRTVQTWLEDGVTALPSHVLDNVLDQVPAIRQERSWLAGPHLTAQSALKLVLAAAAVVALAVAGLTLIPNFGSGIGDPLVGPPSTSPSPSMSPSASPTSTVSLDRVDMIAVGGSVRLSLEAPGWNSVSEVGDPGFAVVRGITGPPNGMSVYFYEVGNTYTDACAHELRDPVVGPTVEDLVQALGELPSTTATEPVDATLAGYPARYLVLTSDDSLPCAPSEFYFWQDPGGGQNWAQSPGQVVRTWVFEVDGTRIVASALSYPTASPTALAEQQSILDSIQFE